jgi:hypothetical protein
VTASLGDRALSWMLRRLHQAVRLEQDLVLVHDSPALADVGPSVDVRGEPWRVARVTGELTLRDALPEADRLIAIVPAGFPTLPMDIAARTYLRRVLDLRAEDLVAAASDRFCEALTDEGLGKAVFESLDTLHATAGRWSLGDLVTAREVRSVLVAAELGTARLGHEKPSELLARWIVEGAPKFRAVTLIRTALAEAYGRKGQWLGWALTEGSLELLCAAGALMASAAGAARAPAIPDLTTAEHTQLVELVESALYDVWRRSPARARDMLAIAERSARESKPDLAAERHRLLRVPLEAELSRHANDCAAGQPPEDVKIEGLRRNLHASDLVGEIDVVASLARLSRFQQLKLTTGDRTPFVWLQHAQQDVAWADLAYRRVRRVLESIPAWLGDPARRALASWVSYRDAINVAFAESMATHWPALAKSTDVRHPLALHQLTRCVVRRLVDDGNRVLLLVLDGCDLASFLEILDSIPEADRIGLALPEVQGAVLHDDLQGMKAFGVAISPLPTVTSHSRRALFAGEIPGNTALDDTESAAANATADQKAWSRNTALGETPRRLFLKGDLGANGQPLIDALRSKKERVIAAVWNGVDDALSSKETTPLPSWSLGALGASAADVLKAALDEGWCVLVTADHGHTPFVSPDRKAGTEGLGQRFSAEPQEGAVPFREGPLPRQPLYLLTRFGAWLGHQSRGFHGGAGIEEVVVPLAFVGRVRGGQEGRVRPPGWWWSSEGLAEAPSAAIVAPGEPPRIEPPRLAPPAPPSPVAPVAPGTGLDAEPGMESLAHDERLVVALLRKNQSARLTVIAQHVKKPLSRAPGFMQQLIRKLSERGGPKITVEVLPDNDRLYSYHPAERGNR